jgi:hypothetical protein
MARAATPKRARKPKARTKPNAPFPFLGQGDARYYEWFSMWIWFEEPVPKTQRKAVLKDAPELCKLDATWPDPSLLWASTGDQWIQMHLITEYGAEAAKKSRSKGKSKDKSKSKPKSKEVDLDDDFDDLDFEGLEDGIAENGEDALFNADIERWLRALHARRPILFVVRREDGEAGGTDLGPWHNASVELFRERVVPRLEAVVTSKLKADDTRREPIRIALEYVGEKSVKPALRKLVG